MTYLAGQGFRVRRGTASGASLPAPGADTFTDLPLLATVKPPGNVRTKNSFKTLDSPDPRSVGGGFEERIVSARLVWDPADAQHAIVLADSETPNATAARRNWQLIAPDPGFHQWDYIAFVSKWEWEDVENEKELAAQVEWSVDGSVVRTA